MKASPSLPYAFLLGFCLAAVIIALPAPANEAPGEAASAPATATTAAAATPAAADPAPSPMDLQVTQAATASAPAPGVMTFSETHPALALSPDKSELIRLPGDAQSVVVGNPAHASVLLDGKRTLVVVPRSPGATHFTVLGAEGDVLMSRHLIVAGPKDHYIRIRRSCGASGAETGCRPTSVYFCPDICHEVASDDGTGNS